MSLSLSLNAFRRVTTSGRFIPEIDGIRFLAIFSVLICHAFQIGSGEIGQLYPDQKISDTFYHLMLHGRQGVTLFFVLSGFILAVPFARQFLLQSSPVRLKTYFLRRLTRLEVPYLLSLFVFFIASVYLIKRFSFTELFPHWIASSLYLHNILYSKHSFVSTVAWTLEIEVQFYILAPFLMQVFRLPVRIRRFILIFFLILSSIGYEFINQHTDNGMNDSGLSEIGYSDLWQMTLPGFLCFFLGGILIADLYVSKSLDNLRWIHPLFSIVGAILIYLYGFGRFLWEPFWTWLWPLIMTGIVTLGLYVPFWRRLWSLSFLTILGGMCYSIYLWHHAFMALLVRNTFLKSSPFESIWPPLFIYMAYLIIASVFLSSGLFLLVEKPCMYPDWPKQLRRRIRMAVNFS